MDEITALREEVRFLRGKVGDTMSAIELLPEQRCALLIAEARRWIGIQESGGNNRGQLVEIFQRQSNIAPGDPWCMAFVQYCVREVDVTAYVLNPSTRMTTLARGASCVGVWEATDPKYRFTKPAPGHVVVWRHRDGLHGHTGIVVGVKTDGTFRTVEGNTSPEQGVQREGDGVFSKKHSLSLVGSLELVGFIQPWGSSL